MKNAGLIVKAKGDNLSETVKNVLEVLAKYDICPMAEKETVERFNLDIPYFSATDMRRMADFVIVLGGDGTLLYTARMFRLVEIPILAFNLGHLGFIIELDIVDFENVICDTINNKITVKRRMKLTSAIYEDNQLVFEEESLNEVVINKGAPSRMLELSIYIDGVFVAKYRSDGLIISTPTGSTGYTISAGGPIVHPDLDMIILSPICPHALNMRPIVIPHSSSVEVRVVSPGSESFITFDGQIVKPFKNNHKIVVKKSPVYANIVSKPGRDYYSVLRDKLGWGGDIC